MNDKLSGKQADLAGDDLEMLKKLSTAYQSVRTELGKVIVGQNEVIEQVMICLLYTSPSPRDATLSRMPSSA